jgi:hypothetical protein
MQLTSQAKTQLSQAVTYRKSQVEAILAEGKAPPDGGSSNSSTTELHTEYTEQMYFEKQTNNVKPVFIPLSTNTPQLSYQ